MRILLSFLFVFAFNSFSQSQIITTTEISPNEDYLIAGTSNGDIYIFDIFSPKIIYKKKHIGAVTDIEFAPQKDEFLSVGLGGNLFCWNISGNILTQRPTHTNERLFSVTITPGEAMQFLYGGSNGHIYLCDYNSFKLIDIYKTNHQAISGIYYSQHYNDEFIINYYDGSFEKRDVVSKNDVSISSKKRDIITEVTYTLDNSNYIIGYEDGIIEVYDESSNKKTKRFSDFKLPIASLDVTTGNSYLLAGSKDSTAILWDLDLRKKLFTIPNHNGWVMGAYFLENENLIITVSNNNTLYFWDRGSLSQKGYLIFNKDSFCYFFNDRYELFGKQNSLQRFSIMNDLIDYNKNKGLYIQILKLHE